MCFNEGLCLEFLFCEMLLVNMKGFCNQDQLIYGLSAYI